jgi:DNA-binding LytR/AlgR family response regulator
MHREESFLLVKADRKIHKVPVDEIVYIESLDEYVKLHLSNKVLVSRENISSLFEKLTHHSFLRIHRSFVISIKYVKSVSADGVEVNGNFLPFGRMYKQSALAALGIRTK